MTHGFTLGGGVPTVVRWLHDGLIQLGDHTVDIHDLATSRADPASRRLTTPTTWFRRSLHQPGSGWLHEHWGANAVELEPMRYRARRQLTQALAGYNLIQVVAGAPAWAHPVTGLGVPVVLQVATLAAWERAALLAHSTGMANHWRAAMTRRVSRLERTALRRVDAVLVENPAMAAFARSVGQERVILAPPGVDTSAFTPGDAGWRRHGHLLSVCRLSDPRKGLDRLLHAYADILHRRPDAPDLVLAGRGGLPVDLRALISRRGLANRVVVRPNVNSTDLINLYRGASVFLQASHEEGLGISVLEAMSCGLPVVSTATEGAVETVVDGDTGWLVPLEPADKVPATVADRTLRLLAGPGGDFGARGRRRCEELFSTRETLHRFLETYEQLLAPARGRATVH